MEAKVTGNKINIEGATYGINDLDTIPDNLVSKSKQEKNVEGGLAYRGQESVFSNLYMAAFELEGTRFNSFEQYYQYSKAVACNKHSRARKILQCSDPPPPNKGTWRRARVQSRLATRVPTPNSIRWNQRKIPAKPGSCDYINVNWYH